MTNVSKMLCVIVMNIFFHLMFSVAMEYNSLTERFQQLENNVAVSTKLAISSSTASEELFSSEYQDKMSSYGVAYSDSASLTSSSVILYRDEQWYHGNTYVMAKFYQDNNRFPDNEIEYRSYATGFDTKAIYQWLFGNAGQSYTDSGLSWGNKSISTKNAIGSYSSNRTPTSNFADFYKAIGHKIKTKGNVKVKVGSSDYNVTQVEYSVLDNMGLDFSGLGVSTNTGTSTQYLTDNFCMSVHSGKSSTGDNTIYFLTPYSLGVTYIPTEVLKPTFLANLETMLRLQKMSSGNLENTTSARIIETLNSADECLPTSVYEDSVTSTSHVHNGSNHIVTDGLIEYDMDSIQMRVDYFLVDFYDTSNRDIVAAIEGSMGGYNFDGSKKSLSVNEVLNETVYELEDSDTGYMSLGYLNGDRIVAKVTVRMKVYAPYQSTIMQWLTRLDWDGVSDNHFGIKLWNPDTKTVSTDDGVWYEYSTYTAITR